MGTIFNHLNVPQYWRQYWDKYPEGYTILEALLNWVSQVDSMVDNVNTWNTYLDDFVKSFDKELQGTVQAIIDEMLADGSLADILDDSIFDLHSRGINVKHPPAPLVGVKMDNVTDDSAAFQALIDYYTANGGAVLIIPEGTMLLNTTVNLKSNVHLRGIGWTSRIRTSYGSTGNGMNLLQIVEQENITIANLKLEGTGYGKSGEWTPVGSLVGAGSLIVAANSKKIIVKDNWLYNGGGMNGGEGVGNVWFSCCENSKIINNTIEKGDNGICVDRWFSNYIADGKNRATAFNDGVVVSGNNIFDMTGRGLAIENINSKGSLVISNNTIVSCAYAGIDGRDFTNCIITGNTFEGSQHLQTRGSTTALMQRGLYILNGCNKVIISNNNFQNIAVVGMQLFNADDFNINHNSLRDITGDGITIKNDATDLKLGSIIGNVLNNVVKGIYLYKDGVDAYLFQDVVISGNAIRFTDTGIYTQYAAYCVITGNELTPITSFGGSVGLRTLNSLRFSIANNNTRNCTNGIQLGADAHSRVDGGVVENCSNAIVLQSCENTLINAKIRGGTTAYNITGGATSQSKKCLGIGEITDTPTVKNGNGIIVKYRSSGKPTTNVCDVGDMVENTTPTVGGYIGWVCTSQNNGNWNSYGLIS
jgi:hypothetical protein